MAVSQTVAHFEGMHGGETHQRIHVGKSQHAGIAASADTGGFQLAIDKLQRPRRGEKAGTGVERDLEAVGVESSILSRSTKSNFLADFEYSYQKLLKAAKGV